MSALWKNAGIQREYFHEAFDETESLSDAQILELKNEFGKFIQGEHGNAAKEIAETYSLLADAVLAGKKASLLDAQLANVGFSLEEECLHKGEIAEYVDAMEELLEVTKKYSLQANAVQSSYANEAAEIGLEEMPASFEEEEFALEELKDIVLALETEC